MRQRLKRKALGALLMAAARGAQNLVVGVHFFGAREPLKTLLERFSKRGGFENDASGGIAGFQGNFGVLCQKTTDAAAKFWRRKCRQAVEKGGRGAAAATEADKGARVGQQVGRRHVAKPDIDI